MLKDAKVKRVGFEANFTTFGQIDAVDRAVKAIKEACADGDADELQLVPLEDVMANIRKVKDDNEIDLIRKSVAIAEEAFEADSLGDQGRADRKLSGRAVDRWNCGRAEHRRQAFPVIVAAGANSSLPHYRPGEAKCSSAGSAAADRLGRGLQRILQRPDAHADDRPGQPAR